MIIVFILIFNQMEDCQVQWNLKKLEIWVNDIYVEYNFCVDDGENCCAIYKGEINEKNCMETDYNTFVHYEIDFDNENWKEELENAMCEAMIDFHDLYHNL